MFDTGWVFGLVGAGGFAREVMPFVVESLSARAGRSVDDSVFFVETEPQHDVINGIKCISEREFFQLDCDRRLFNIAVADSRTRQRLAQEWLARGATAHSLVSPTAAVLAGNCIGDGAILCGRSTVTSNAQIGAFFHLNIYSYVAHDCVLGDFVTFAPNVACNGNIHIGDHAYIGTGAVIKQGTPERPLLIGEGAVVGMGAVVTKDVEPHTTVVGNPARPR
jgi:sugar O-acyltransferase (sialic acid O-acetyltransferase NeuD family)